jgi:hypothetical protein
MIIHHDVHDDHDVLALRTGEASPLLPKATTMGERMTRIKTD